MVEHSFLIYNRFPKKVNRTKSKKIEISAHGIKILQILISCYNK